MARRPSEAASAAYCVKRGIAGLVPPSSPPSRDVRVRPLFRRRIPPQGRGVLNARFRGKFMICPCPCMTGDRPTPLQRDDRISDDRVSDDRISDDRISDDRVKTSSRICSRTTVSGSPAQAAVRDGQMASGVSGAF